ncbi:TPA: phospholipase [Salmonella enterica subsp. salamae serovar [1],40:z35:e,n,x,z15]|nr:phospholipase [Salmonella enterica subsp. salamae serovar [1],40:z35:e,n,x,z15]
MSDNFSNCTIYFTDESKKSKVAHCTDMYWVHYTTKIDGKGIAQNFAQYTVGNCVEACLGGKAYYKKLLSEFGNAKESIYITGWQVNWDALLEPGKRLVDALWEQVKVKPQLKVYIMPWKCMSPVQTYDRATERVFAALNLELGRDAFYVRLAGEQSGIFFSHHQKCVIIDESVAFVGGIDLAYGRYDENTGEDGKYNLVANTEGRQGMNMYNSCICYTDPANGYDPMDEYVHSPYPVRNDGQDHEQENAQNKKREQRSARRIADIVLNKKGDWQRPDKDGNDDKKKYHYLDASIQPRMPWQDYQIRIEGPAVDDLVRNFVSRWNSYRDHSKENELQTDKPVLTWRTGYTSLQPGKCQVQVLRSASLDMRIQEYNGTPEVGEPQTKQDDILRAMNQLIHNAEHYIYIENQFFISAFGEPSVPDNAPYSPEAKEIARLDRIKAVATKLVYGDSDKQPVNQIAQWLGDRIKNVIYARYTHDFHVCIVLPVHPEGKLDDGSIMAQVHLTRQSLASGSRSLLNRVRQALWVRQQLDKDPRANWSALIPGLEKRCEAEKLYEEISFEACAKYVTLLNLRGYAELAAYPGDKKIAVTEQIYVHSKLMIVDDRYVLVGSANINERSLLGDRDSELAVLISDTEGGYNDIDGSDIPSPYRAFARDFRKKIWTKLLGDAAGEYSDFLEKPAKAENWQKIRELAINNARIYESVFDFIPRNYSNKTYKKDSYEDDADGDPASLWPVLNVIVYDIRNASEYMPFSIDFWNKYKKDINFRNAYQDKNKMLKNIKGYITLLPVHWAEGENNLVDYHIEIVN